jgi:type IV secretory pathway VirJ component
MKDSQKLAQLFNEDQADRKTKKIDWDKVSKRDTMRQRKVSLMLKKGLIKTARDHYHAAMIFQHAIEVSGNKLAQRLAKKSADLGEEDAKWLYAAATDRILMRQSKKQKYGTQYTQRHIAGPGDKVERIYELYPCNEKTTDEERRKYNVPTLEEAKKLTSTFN